MRKYHAKYEHEHKNLSHLRVKYKEAGENDLRNHSGWVRTDQDRQTQDVNATDQSENVGESLHDHIMTVKQRFAPYCMMLKANDAGLRDAHCARMPRSVMGSYQHDTMHC